MNKKFLQRKVSEELSHFRYVLCDEICDFEDLNNNNINWNQSAIVLNKKVRKSQFRNGLVVAALMHGSKIVIVTRAVTYILRSLK